MDFQNGSSKKHHQIQNGSVNFGVGSVMFNYLKKYNNKIFQYIADTDETDTYGEVLTRCIRTALKLRQKGITKDDIISSCTHNHKNTIVPLIASQFLSVKSAHFDPNLSHLDTIHLLKLIKPKVMFVSLESLPFMEKCIKESQVDTELVVFGDTQKYPNFSEYLKPNPEEEKFQPVMVDDVMETALIVFSSGTTGLPKGICLNHYGLVGEVSAINGIWNEDTNHVSLVYTTLYWISAIMFLTKCVVEGSSRVVCAKFDAANTWKLIEKYKITTIFLAPYHARDFVAARQKDVDCSSLQYFATGSTPVTAKLMKDLREALPSAKVTQGYGQTEAGGVITIFNASDSKEYELQIRKPLSCGKIIPGVTWKIVDPNTEEILGPNQRGELRYKIEYQMNGYYKMASSSAYDSDGYLKSGDIVYYDEDDCFYVVDRIKEMFKYRGWHILPAVLEELLMNHPAVQDAVVVGIPHEKDGDHPMGLVVLKKGCENVDLKDIQCCVNQLVSDAQQLRAGVKIVKNVIRTTTGKVRRPEMRKMVLNGDI